MKVYTVEAYNDSIYKLVYAGVYDEEEIMEISPNDYDVISLMITVWKDGDELYHYWK